MKTNLQRLHGNEINGYCTAIRELSRDVHYPAGGGTYTRLLAGNIGLPTAASATEIEDSLDFEAVIRHDFRQRGWVFSHYSAEHYMLFVCDMDEVKNEEEKGHNGLRRSSSSSSAGRRYTSE